MNVSLCNSSERSCSFIPPDAGHSRVLRNSAEFHANPDVLTTLAARTSTSDMYVDVSY